MEIRKIGDSIYYVGVNDRELDRFEGLWPLPYGVTYNSYIVKGESHTALIDTVAISECSLFINNIEDISGHPDYLIITHMEPDHSGSIPMIVKRYPNLKIVANKIAIGMIKGFYNLTDPELYIEVKDGDIIDLGGENILRFISTPMVHWPETTMIYFEKELTVFSGDAFGCFGAVNGTPLDSDCDFPLFEGEMRRYYAAIVGKYSPFVRKAFDKIGKLPIKRICSTHGPVWKKYADKVIKLYYEMSSQTAEDGVIVVYGSMYGNTEKAANRFASLLVEKGLFVRRIYNVGKTDLSFILADVWRYKGLVVASPTYSLDIFPPMDSFIHALEIRGLKGKIVASIGNYAWAPRIAAEKMAERLSSLGLEVVGKVPILMAVNEESEEQMNLLADKFVETYRNS